MLGVKGPHGVRVLGEYDLKNLLAAGVDLAAYGQGADGPEVEIPENAYLPPVGNPQKILCVGLNYTDHAKEGGHKEVPYPTLFTRFSTTLLGHNQAIVRPKGTDSLDYECEMAVIIKKNGRHIPKDKALAYVAGYAPFNDASVRELQRRTSQWTTGKNCDATGPFGPEFVTADELPPGGRGLKIATRVNGQLVQSDNTNNMIFDVPVLISLISQYLTLEAGDVIITGTPSGVGSARTPKLFLHGGDTVEVSLEGFAPLRNPVVDEQ